MQEKSAQYYLQKAFLCLRDGNRIEARKWAVKAIDTSHDLVDGWILLAKLGSPKAKRYYLGKALEIDPNNGYARKALEGYIGQRRPSNISRNSQEPGDAAVEYGKPVIIDYRQKRYRKRGIGQFIFTTMLVVVISIISLTLWITFSNDRTVLAEAPSVLKPTGVVLKPSLTPTATSTHRP